MSGLAAGPRAQPAKPRPTACTELRAVVAKSPADGRTEIQVSGEVRRIDCDGAATHLTVCAPPDPVVLCVAEAAEDRQVGEVLVVKGVASPRGPGLLVIEPCLHHVP